MYVGLNSPHSRLSSIDKAGLLHLNHPRNRIQQILYSNLHKSNRSSDQWYLATGIERS